MSHIPIAFGVLGVLATFYALALTFDAKTRDLRTRHSDPKPESHSMSVLERLTRWWRAR
jgi:hypothetical protein